MEAPRTLHWDDMICIIRYLKQFPSHGILYRKSGHLRIEGFTNVDWEGSPSNRRSTTGTLLLGKARNRQWLFNLVQRLSIGLWLIQLVN
jgi:hypothetical protein